MKRTFRPAAFLGTAVLLCTAWLWARPPVSAVDTVARDAPRRAAPVEPASIALDPSILERYAGRYEGRGDYAIDLALKDGTLLLQVPGWKPFELLPTSETEFFLTGMGYDVEFDVADDGTVRGLSANTEYGLVEMTRVR